MAAGETRCRHASHKQRPDPLGSTVALYDDTQTKTDTFDYWPYGEVRTRTGTTPTPFQFGGTWPYYRDYGATDYVRRRYYGPTSGRFVTKVPLVHQPPGEHPYGYSSQNPGSFLDPDGLQPAPLPPRPKPVYGPIYWNDPSRVRGNNCYNYACNAPANDFRQPGAISGGLLPNVVRTRYSCANLIANTMRDGLTRTNPRVVGGCPPGYHKVVLYVNNDSIPVDFHWWRQDRGGYWSDKPGRLPATHCYSGTNIPITDPNIDAGYRGYELKCGALCAKN